MTEQRSEDGLLVRLLDAAEAEADYFSILTPEVVKALVRCAEIVQTDYLLLSQSQQAKAARTLKILEER